MSSYTFIVLLAALVLLLASGGVLAADPAVAAGEPIPITGCTEITSPGTYYLASDLIDLRCETAISVRCSNVVIDGRNHHVEGDDLPATVGIDIRSLQGNPGITNVLVENIHLSGWDQGVVVSPAGGETLPTPYVRLSNVHSQNNTEGFDLWGPGTITLDGCTATSNLHNGIRADGIEGDLAVALTDVQIQANGDDGVYARLTGMTIDNCQISFNGWRTGESSGFQLNKGSAIIRDSLFEQNRGAGIFFETATNGTVTGTTIQYNGVGIRDTCGDGTVNIYNNYFRNDRNVALEGQVDTWSVQKRVGPNIVGGPSIGGNFWASPNRTGFSEMHLDVDGDGFCDEQFVIDGGNVDHLPLAMPPVIVPGGTGIPTSTKQDGRFDDVNGNGVLDFNDVVLLFNQMDWIRENEPVVGFDFNGDGQITFADVVWLYGML
jgi:hypothetical protein